jgi:tetratricopeptide (TPR) repeat protein
MSGFYREALIAYKSGHYEAAIESVEKALKEHPQSARPLLLRGRIATAQKKFAAAEIDLRNVLKLDHASNQGYYELGELYFQQRQWAKARAEYFTYHRLDPKNASCLLKMVYCAIADKKIGEAQRLANTLDLFDEKHPAAYFARAALARAEKKAAEEDKFLQQAQTLYGALLFNQYLPDYVFLIAKS